MDFQYIVIEGPIGVGKTAVVNRLAESLDARTMMEEWSENPFLKPFYDGKAGAVFQVILDRSLQKPGIHSLVDAEGKIVGDLESVRGL